MRTEKLSVNKVCMVACAALFLLSIAMPVTIYFLTQNVLALCCGLLQLMLSLIISSYTRYASFASFRFRSGGCAALPSAGEGFGERIGMEWVLDGSVVNGSLVCISLFNCVGFPDTGFSDVGLSDVGFSNTGFSNPGCSFSAASGRGCGCSQMV